MSCCGQRRTTGNGVTAPHVTGPAPSAEAFAASANPRYLVLARQTSNDGKRFSTLTAAQDYARRTGGIIRQL